MKLLGSFLSKMAAYGVAAAIMSLAIGAQAQVSKKGTAKVNGLRGSAQFSKDGSAWSPLKVGTVLSSGGVIKTGPASSVDLYLKDNGPVVRVTPDTTLALDKLLFDDTGADVVVETQLDLKNGRILGTVKKLAAASKYEIKIPTGTVGIRGTQYDVSTSGQVRVLEGQVLVTYLNTRGEVTQYTVNAGQTFSPPATPGAAPIVGATVPADASANQAVWSNFIDSANAIVTSGGVVVTQPIANGQTPSVSPKGPDAPVVDNPTTPEPPAPVTPPVSPNN